jgi:hypothetical protein
MAEYRIWPATDGPGVSFNDASPISQGNEFYVSSTAWATKLWYWKATAAMGTDPTLPVLGQLYRIDGGGLATPLLGSPVSFTFPTGLGWQSVDIPPIQLTAVQRYKTVVYYPNGEYTYLSHYWDAGGPGEFGLTNGPLVAVAANTAVDGQSSYIYGAGLQYPTGNSSAANYWMDVTVTDVNPAGAGPRASAFMSFFE